MARYSFIVLNAPLNSNQLVLTSVTTRWPPFRQPVMQLTQKCMLISLPSVAQCGYEWLWNWSFSGYCF